MATHDAPTGRAQTIGIQESLHHVLNTLRGRLARFFETAPAPRLRRGTKMWTASEARELRLYRPPTWSSLPPPR